MKKILPPVLLGIGFCAFLVSQILWNTSPLGAQGVNAGQSKEQLYETLFKESKFTTIEKQSVELKSLSAPLLVVNFWASWCAPCLKEFPSLVALQKKLGKDLVVVGINGDEDEPLEAIAKTKKKFGLEFHHVIDPRSEISDRFGVTSYPFSLIYARGKIIHIASKHQDFMDPKLLEKIEASVKVAP